MIKMEIRAFTIKYSKQTAKATHNEEKRLWLRLEQLQESLDKKYSDTDKDEMNKIKAKLDSGMKITSPKEILKEEETFFQTIYRSRNKDPNLPEFNQSLEVLSAEMAATCEGYITIEECANVLKNNGK